ncbi:very long chain fatty acid elongase F-like [Drosophila montana]|uniref:very long chain fatty acid elongase F-like n=1 Tax=Drosophila montana TaxID=40370 RepID=UPI00313E1A03
MIYNAAMFSYDLYFIFVNTTYDLRCMESLPHEHPLKDTERWLTYIYFLNKMIDLLDTVFFVLRKSSKQITVLHVYHHFLMVSGMYWVLRLYGVGGQYMMMGLFNTFVHTVMYFYYFISAMYPELKSSLWWKKYITGIQILQFILLFLQSLSQSSIMIVMFGNFYYNAYVKPKQQKQRKEP